MTTNPKRIHTITNWSSSGNHNTDKQKAPSMIRYHEQTQKPTWGYAVRLGDSSALKWFKLLLVDETDLQPTLQTSSQILAARLQLSRANKTAVEVIADYLRELWAHCNVRMNRVLGEEMCNNTKLVVSITLPAIWPNYAQARMREAVTLAGILDERPAGETVVRFISEPEAAALATFEDMADQPDIKPGDHVVVCDAGGGTVDIITYTVVSTNPLVVKESIRGDGALCGAIFLDEAFQKLLRRKISRDVWQKLGNEGVARIMNDDWENCIKPQCSTEDTSYHILIPFGGNAENNYQPSEIVFQSSEIRGIFNPIVERVDALVTAQLIELKRLYKKRPKYVVLVGGFGKSNYLYEFLRKTIHKEIEILQDSGDRPWTSICRGAVLNGLMRDTSATSVVVDSRIARASYGTSMNILPWDPLEHDPKDKVWCRINENFLAVDQVQWFLRIDDAISSDEPVVHTFWQDFEKPEDDIVTELVVCMDDNPPSRCTPAVKELCKIRWSKIPNFASLPTWKNRQGQVYRQVQYDIKMTMDSGSLDFAVYHNGIRMASQNVSVEFGPANESSWLQSDSDAFSD
ncbi:Heat shock 70 kDa protein 12B [Paramyrothecium foliicola]|nr:Heat shock 70 kDa protein 12B [Paramyrothecium foliicola]